MKKLLLILFFIAFHSYICNAQNQTVSDSNKIERLKREYITRQLELSPIESKAFWPTYRNYNLETINAWQQCNHNRNIFKEKVAAIRDKYRPVFVQILHSHERANSVYKLEREYREMLNKELQQRQNN